VCAPSSHAAELPSCRISHSRGIPSRLQLSKNVQQLRFFSGEAFFGLMRRSIVNQQFFRHHVEIGTAPLCPPSIKIELRALLRAYSCVSGALLPLRASAFEPRDDAMQAFERIHTLVCKPTCADLPNTCTRREIAPRFAFQITRS